MSGDPDCRTGFSREGVGSYTTKLMALKPASSRLKPVPLTARAHLPQSTANTPRRT
jgi:hypothetical protein